MSVFNSLNVSVLIVLLVAGLIMGVTIAGTDILNPSTSAAEANRMDIETAHQKAMNEIQERLAIAKTDAEVSQIERDQKLLDAKYEHDIQALAMDLQHNDLAFKTWMTILTFLAGAVSIGIIVVSIVWAISRKPVKTATHPAFEKRATKASQTEQDEEVKKYWRQRREWARDNEEWFRSVALTEARLTASTNPQTPESAQHSNLPLAI